MRKTTVACTMEIVCKYEPKESRLSQCIENGRYQDYLHELNNCVFEGSMERVWANENNRLVCQYKLGATTEDRRDVEKGFRQLLSQLLGVPTKSEDVLWIYLAAVHNSVQLQQQLSDSLESQQLIADSHNVLLQAIQILYEFLGYPYIAEDRVTAAVVQRLLQATRHKLTTLSNGLHMLSYDCAVLLLKQGEYTQAETIVIELRQNMAVKERSSRKRHKREEAVARLLLSPDPGLYRLTQLLLITVYVCRHDNNKYSQALSLLAEMEESDDAISGHTLFVKAWLQFQMNQLAECQQTCVEILNSSLIQSQKLIAKCHNLIGCCLANQNKPHTAIKHFQVALNTDWSDMTPLYNVSVQYHRLKLTDAELECLNLIVVSFEEKDGEKKNSDIRVNEDVIDDVLQRHLAPEISHAGVLYTLAHRCMQYERYDAAVTRYQDLITLIKSRETAGYVKTSCSDVMELSVPAISRVHLELAYCLLCSGNYGDCITICDVITEGDHDAGEESDEELREMLAPPTPVKHTRTCSTLTEAEALVYKSDALTHLSSYTQAEQTLYRAVASIESILRQKVKDLRENPGQSTLAGHNTQELSLLFTCHLNLCHLHVIQDTLKHAIHHSTMALLYQPDRVQANHSHTVVLLKCGRQLEAVTHWLGKHRGIDTAQERHTLSTLLAEKQQALPGSDTRLATEVMVSKDMSKEDCDRLDVCCLSYLVNNIT